MSDNARIEIFEGLLLSFVAALCVCGALLLCVLETFVFVVYFPWKNYFWKFLEDCDKGAFVWTEFAFSLL